MDALADAGMGNGGNFFRHAEENGAAARVSVSFNPVLSMGLRLRVADEHVALADLCSPLDAQDFNRRKPDEHLV